MKWIGRAALIALAALVALAGVLLVRTFSFEASPPPEVALVAPPEIPPDQPAARLSRAIQFETVSREFGVFDPAPFAAMHAFLREAYPRTFSALTVEQPVGASLLMTWRGTDPGLPAMVLIAHQDVVPVEEGGGAWDAPPFSGAIQNGFVYGRGALDDKGSIIAILEGVEALLAQGFTPRRTIILAFGHDEEISGRGAAAMAKLLEGRGPKAWFVLDEGMAIVSDFPLTGKPAALIGVAEKGYLSVRVAATAAGGHSSTAERLPAADRLAQALVAIDRSPFEGGFGEGPAGAMIRATSPDLPFVRRLALANLWLFAPLIDTELAKSPAAAAMLSTTSAPTVLGGGTKDNVLPQEVWAIVNLRLHPRDSIESALAHLRAATSGIEGLSIEPIEETASQPSPVSSTTSDSYALIAAAARAVAPEGAPVAPALVLGATDARHYRNAAENVYRFTPMILAQADLARIHGANERLSVEGLAGMARFYATLIATGAR